MKDKGPGPLLFKPPPKWQVLSALGGALAVHGIAVALAFHKEPPPIDTSDIPTASIEATLDQPAADEPTPPPEDVPVPEAPPPPEIQANVAKVRLVRNPLRKDKRPVVELGIGFSSEGSYIKTSDGLPLFKVSETPNVTRAGIAAKGENAVDIWQDDGTSVHQFRISNVDQMMAFDCGEFELK